MGFQKALPGSPMSIPARIYNKLVDVALGQNFDAGQDVPPFFLNSTIVKVKNDSGDDVDRFEVLGLEEPLILVSQSLDGFQQEIMFKGALPTTADYTGKFG